MVNNVFDSIIECFDYIDSIKENDSVTKKDLIDSISMRLSIMVSRSILPGPSFLLPADGWSINDGSKYFG